MALNTQQFTFEEHDKLNRKPFADFLLSLIQHRNEYRRPDSNASYSIAIDAVYGSGKTRFLRMFESQVKLNGQYKIAYYSAWEHDLYDDALAPILALLDRPAGVFEDQAYSRMEKNFASKALHILKRLSTSFISMKAKKHFGEDYTELIDDIKVVLGEESVAPDAYDLRMKCIKELQRGLQEITEETPLIFIIDELDRCNPAFAIKTLEVAKHLLDVSNVVFIFALDMHQMRAAIRKFYGQDIDADGYLCKVFDYMTLLPLPTTTDYIMEYLTSLDPHIQSDYKEFCSFAVELFQTNCCSLRFIDTLFSAYRIMWHTFLHDYDSNNAYCLYLFAIFLKFQHPDIFLQTTRTFDIPHEQKKNIYGLANKGGGVLGYINSCTKQIGSTTNYLNVKEHQLNFHSIKALDLHNVAVMHEGRTHKYGVDSESNINGVLFIKDIHQYEQIKHLTFGQFIHRQLEMYNPISTEETVADFAQS